jgi:hypothetical protein
MGLKPESPERRALRLLMLKYVLWAIAPNASGGYQTAPMVDRKGGEQHAIWNGTCRLGLYVALCIPVCLFLSLHWRILSDVAVVWWLGARQRQRSRFWPAMVYALLVCLVVKPESGTLEGGEITCGIGMDIVILGDGDCRDIGVHHLLVGHGRHPYQRNKKWLF